MGSKLSKHSYKKEDVTMVTCCHSNQTVDVYVRSFEESDVTSLEGIFILLHKHILTADS